MIIIANIHDINTEDYNKVYICMRSIDSLTKNVTNHKNVIHLPELSPSTHLFLWSQKMKKQFQWTENVFAEQYVPLFLQEMQSDSACQYLGKLIEESNANMKIAVCCSCPREDLCHRSILAGLLYQDGSSTEVTNLLGKPLYKYKHYFQIFCQ